MTPSSIYPRSSARWPTPGLAYLHIVFADPDQRLFRELRKDWPGTLIANPVLPVDQIPADGGRHAGERLLAAGADLVAFGRPFLANPDLVERMRIGAPVNPLRDLHLYLGGETGYTDYPVLAAVVHQPEALELAGAR